MRGESYIKLYRKMLDWEHFKDSNTVHVFLFLLISAVGNDTVYNGFRLKCGQFVTTVKKISESTGMTTKQVRRCIDVLKESGEIKTDSTNQYTVFTVLNYSEYQGQKRKKSEKPYDLDGSYEF